MTINTARKALANIVTWQNVIGTIIAGLLVGLYLQERGESRDTARLDAQVEATRALVAANAEAIRNLGVKVDANAEMIRNLGVKVDANTEAVKASTEAVEALGDRVDANTGAMEALGVRVDANTGAMEALGAKVDEDLEALAEGTERRLDTVERRGLNLEDALRDVVRTSARNEARIEALNSDE